MKKILKCRRLFFSLLLSLMIINLFSTSVTAFNISSNLDIKQIVYSNVNKIVAMPTTYTDQRGLFKGVKNLLIGGLWVDYIFNNKEGLDFSDTEKELYYSNYRNKLTEFIDKYNEAGEGEKFIPITLTEPSTAQSQADFTYLVTSFGIYMDSYFNTLLTEYDKKDANGKELFLSDNKSKILMAYLAISRFTQEYDVVHELTAKVDNGNKYYIDTSPISKVLLNSKYKVFFDLASKEIERGINSSGDITLSEGKAPIDKFTYVDPDSKTKQEYVNKAYLASFSASSLYIPLQSKVGEESFTKALSYMVNGNADVLNAYAELSAYKKPLYIRDYDEGNFTFSKPATTGDATRITIGQLIDLARDGKKGSLVTIKGKFLSTEDSDVYKMSFENGINRFQNGQESGTYSEEDLDKEDSDKEDSDKEETSDTSSEVLEYEGDYIVLEETIPESRSDSFTESIMDISGSGMAGINSMLLVNTLSDKNPEVKMSDTSFYNKQLYINAFGDIVLSDNTVVVAGASNASYYSEGKDIIYNPFTDAFMDSYPAIYKQEEFLVPEPDIGKIAATVQDDADKYNNYLIPFYYKGATQTQGLKIPKTDKVKKVYTFDSLYMNPIDIGMYDPVSGDKQMLFKAQTKKFNFGKGMLASSGRAILTLDTNVISSDGISVALYPVDNAKGTESEVRNSYVVNSFYAGMVLNEDETMSKISNDRFNIGKFYDIMIEVYNGKTSVYGYEKGIYNSLVVEETGIFAGIVKFIKDIATSVITQFGEAPGMLGLRSAMQDRIMGSFLYYARILLPYMSLLVGIMFLILYAKSADNFTFIVFKAICVCAIAYVSIYYVPKYLSNITNLPVNNGSNYLGFDSLKLRQEMMIDKSNVTATYSDYGKFGFANSSITLYCLSEEQLEELCETYDVQYLDISSGGSFVIDDSSGLFVQGDKIKLNLDRLFNTTSINTKIETSSNLTYYTLEKLVYVNSVLDYYIPFNVIEEGLIDKLNDLSEVYRLTRTTLPYPRNIRKDNFFVNSYVNSPVFLSPEDPRDSDREMNNDVYDALIDKFYDGQIGSEDWLGFHNSMKRAVTSNEFNDSLWLQTMTQNGFIGDEEINTKKYNNLVFYVNDNTKKFLIDNKDILSYMSDENLIEITSLYATILFNNEVSEFGNKLYPGRLNYEELTVIDSIRPVITKDYNRYTGLSRNLTDYVQYEYGPFGLIGLSLIVLFQGLTSLCLTYALYIIYLMLLIFLFLKLMFKNPNLSDTFSGFLKLYGLLLLVYFINIKSFQILNNFSSSGLTLFFLLIISSAVLGITTSVIYYVVTGMSTLDFSNNRINGTFSKILGKLPFVSNLVGKDGRFRDLVVGGIRKGQEEYDPLGLNTSDYDVYRDTYADARSVKVFIEDKYNYHYDYKQGYERHVPKNYGSKKSSKKNVTLEDDGVDLN